MVRFWKRIETGFHCGFIVLSNQGTLSNTSETITTSSSIIPALYNKKQHKKDSMHQAHLYFNKVECRRLGIKVCIIILGHTSNDNDDDDN